MSVKELCARLSVLLVMCAIAVSAKATPTITPIPGEDKGYTITINEPEDFGIFDDGDNVFYEEDGTVVRVSEIKELAIVTTEQHKLDKPKATTLLSNCTNLDYLDLENCDVAGVTETGGANPFLGNGHPNPFKNRLKTLVFPKTAGMIIPASAFEGDTELETVIFPDNKGSYQIMAYAFMDSKVKTVSLGKGYSIPDMQADWNQAWSSPSGSGESIFEHCKDLVNVVLDNSITALGEKAFSATYSLEYLILPEDLEHFGALCCKESGIRTITIPDKVYLGPQAQAFQGCIRLSNVYVNADNVQIRTQGIMEMNQTFNFTYTAGDNPTYSAADYQASNTYTASDYSDCPFVGKSYSIPILHYPGTDDAIKNYRVPFYLHYQGVDPATGTTWPNADDIANKENGKDGYDGYTSFWNNNPDGLQEHSDVYAGWRQFLIGNNTFKEQKVFYDERIKESRWYSICLPINMTEAQFVNAYGVGAALHEFSGAVYNKDENMITLQFDKLAQVDESGYLLKKNVPYMIHPAKIKFSKRKEIRRTATGVEFIKETVEGQEQYVTKDVIATFDADNDLLVKWDVLLAGGEPLAEVMNAIANNTKLNLDMNSVTQHFVSDNLQPIDFNFKGSYLGAQIYGPGDIGGHQVYLGTSPKLPEGAYYLGYDPDHGINTPQFFKSKGKATWSPYCALVVSSDPNATSGAKEFNVLDVDFNKTDIVVTKIGNPTIQIPVIKTDNKIYNLNGQVVRENSKDTNGLKGIYVVGGKKVVFN